MSLSLRLTLVSLILIAVSLSPLSFLLQNSGGALSETLRYAASSMARGVRGEVEFFFDLRTLKSESEALASRLQQIKGELAELREVERENDRLRKQLGLKVSKKGKLVLAMVTGLVSEQGATSLIIDQGQSSGVKAGHFVVLENYLVGEVVRVEEDRCVVQLITDPRFSAAALDQSSSERSRGIVQGGFGDKLRMSKILPNEQVNAGDLIISSGLDGKVPAGLVLGEVVNVSSTEGNILKEAELKVLFDAGKLEEVFVVRG